jgi:hypothetical protein
MRPRLAGVLGVVVALLTMSTPGAAAVGQPSPARPGVVKGRTWLLRNSLSGGPAEVSFGFGLAGDRKVMGDWNGDGTRTPGVFRDGTWYLRDRNGASGHYVSFAFGAAGDVPVVGDWNGDGTDTVGVFRTGGYWYLRDSNTAGSINHTARYGAQPGDVPLVGDWTATGSTPSASSAPAPGTCATRSAVAAPTGCSPTASRGRCRWSGSGWRPPYRPACRVASGAACRPPGRWWR